MDGVEENSKGRKVCPVKRKGCLDFELMLGGEHGGNRKG